ISAWDFNSDRIFCYNGALRAFIATYLTKAQAQEIIDDSGVAAVAVDGWYDFDDVGEWGETGTLRCYNDRSIDFGSSGLAVESTVGIRFVGEVKDGAQNVASASYRLVGNCSAADLTLADLKPTDISAWDFNSDRIFCYNGALRAFIATYLTKAQAQEIIDDSGVEAVAVDGWYDFDDVGEWGETGTLRCYNNTSLPAGTGFAVESAIGVIIPSAL
ncbi:MAG: hypothetical protein IKO40_05965, partial [Kiritimatiellae bacterium]|nr:hypothetical protein [Kiritimatiellia bacterium]